MQNKSTASGRTEKDSAMTYEETVHTIASLAFLLLSCGIGAVVYSDIMDLVRGK